MNNLTIKNRKKVGSQPPNQLQFHDEMELEEMPRRRVQQKLKEEDHGQFKEITEKEESQPGSSVYYKKRKKKKKKVVQVAVEDVKKHETKRHKKDESGLWISHQEAVNVFQNNAEESDVQTELNLEIRTLYKKYHTPVQELHFQENSYELEDLESQPY